MPNERPGSRQGQGNSPVRDMIPVEELSDDNNSNPLMDVDEEELLGHVLGGDHFGEWSHGPGGNQNEEFDFANDSEEFLNEDDGSSVEEEDVEDDDEDIDERHFEQLLSANGAHAAIESLNRFRQLISPNVNAPDSEEQSHPRPRNPFLESLRTRHVFPHVDAIFKQLQSKNDAEILSGLEELSSLLLGSDIAGSFIPSETLSSILVNLLGNNKTIEVQVMTARAMSQLIDSSSDNAAILVDAGVIPVLRQMFENVFYIDLIEQLIHVVKPVAIAEPQAVMESGCLLPCVTTLDFFNVYIQKEIMAAIDACAKELTIETADQAKALLAVFPESPNDTVIGAYSSLIIALAKLNQSGFKEVASQNMWDNLINYIQPGTPHISRIMLATAHMASRCPEFAVNKSGIAELVRHTLLQETSAVTTEMFSKLISTSKDNIFAGLKLLQVLLPLPQPIGSFKGPYRTGNDANQNLDLDEVIKYAETAVPLAVAAYSASTSTPVRQISILVVMQVVAIFKHDEQFTDLVKKMDLISFTAQIISEGDDQLVLGVGGMDIAWDIASNEVLLRELLNAGVTADLEQFCGDNSSEPKGYFSATNDLKHLASYMASNLLKTMNIVQDSTQHNVSRLVDAVKHGDFNIKEIIARPLPDMIRAGLLEALETKTITNYLCEDMVTLLQSAVTRLERFDIQLTGTRAKTIEEVVTQLVCVRLSGRNNHTPGSSWVITVPAIATIRSLEEFVRSRTQIRRVFTSAASQAAASTSNDRFHFWVGDNRLPKDISVLKATQNVTGVPVIEYAKVDEAKEDSEEDEFVTSTEKGITGSMGCALRLLRSLAEENERRGEAVNWEKFRSAKITAKLKRQLDDVLAIAASMLPQWTFETVQRYPFLYPLNVRLHFVQLTSFGMGRNLRLLRRMQRESDDNNDDIIDDQGDDSIRILGRHQHQKFRLSRDNVLEGALRLLELSCRNPAIVEVMFIDEQGVGKGPTQEFFVLASQALSSLKLNMWKLTPTGLYPEANPEASEQVLRNFKGMGMLVARALLDKRILDFRLNPAFFEAILSETGPSVYKLRRVDPGLAFSLDKLLDSKPKDLENIGLDFTLPGTEIELLPSGKDIDVTTENVGDYVSLVCDYIVGSGIQKQVDAFRVGFSNLIPVSALNAFMFDELATLCGADQQEDWSLSTLREAFKADHGYNSSSESVQQLYRILSQFDTTERRKFLIFSTGAPRLPVGGFRALNPRFTVVVKHPDNEDLSPDAYLPSVMTCTNYFKLPIYSSEEVMRKQLKLAMNEGAGAFLLS